MVLLYEFKVGLQCYFIIYKVLVCSFDEVIVWNCEYVGREMSLFGQEIMELVNIIDGLGMFEYICVCSDVCCLVGLEGIDVVLYVQQFDVLIVFIIGVVWLICDGYGDDFLGESYSVVVVVGYLSLIVLMVYVDGLLLGLLFMGIVWSELCLIELGFVYEQCIWVCCLLCFKIDMLLLYMVFF